MEHNYGKQLFFGVMTLLALLVTFTSATYAWFTFSTDTNVEPLSGGIGYGEGNLTISDSPQGPFSERCELPAPPEGLLLRPLSTADLEAFYTAKAHDRNGVSTVFAEDTNYTDSALCGSVYLRSEGGECGVYLSPDALDFGDDAQALASLRLGLVFTSSRGTSAHIFKLDDMGDTANAQRRQTIEESGCVVSSVSGDGQADFVRDPAADLSDYFSGGDGDDLSPGRNLLCILPSDEVVRVAYFLYLEGCDENCINAVQSRELALSLGFTGIAASGLST